LDCRKNKLFSPLLVEDYLNPNVINGREGDPLVGRSADDKGLNNLFLARNPSRLSFIGLVEGEVLNYTNCRTRQN